MKCGNVASANLSRNSDTSQKQKQRNKKGSKQIGLKSFHGIVLVMFLILIGATSTNSEQTTTQKSRKNESKQTGTKSFHEVVLVMFLI